MKAPLDTFSKCPSGHLILHLRLKLNSKNLVGKIKRQISANTCVQQILPKSEIIYVNHLHHQLCLKNTKIS